MGKSHKDLPAGSQPWADEVDSLMDEVKQLKEVVRRLTENAGLDMSNPKRGVNSGTMPSVRNPVGQKLSSLADVNSYNVVDGQVLTWSQQEQKWLPEAGAGGSDMVLIEEQHAGFVGATGYGYLPTTESGPYSLLAQNAQGRLTIVARQAGAGVNGTAVILNGKNWSIGYHNTDLDKGLIACVPDDNLTLHHYQGVHVDAQFFKSPTFDASTRNGLAVKQLGGQIYNTTTKKPNWWDGSAWRDAVGNIV